VIGVIARQENRVSIRWKDIAPTMRSATVAIEDKRYWQHGALDWRGIARAALNNLHAGGIRQGGSTISQQLAKNLYLQKEASSRTISRKIDEAWIAVQLEDKYTKAQILAPLQAYVVLPSATAAAKTTYTKAVATEAEAKAAVVAMIEDVIKPLLYQLLGKSNPELETYGLDPVKVPVKTVATKAAAVQKSQATRKALGTKGPVQKKAAKKAVAAEPATPVPAKP